MNNDRISKQFHAIFSIFMVFFYLGVGIFFLFFADMFTLDKALLGIIGSAFILLGLYRIYSTYRKITSAFSREKEEDE